MPQQEVCDRLVRGGAILYITYAIVFIALMGLLMALGWWVSGRGDDAAIGFAGIAASFPLSGLVTCLLFNIPQGIAFYMALTGVFGLCYACVVLASRQETN